jgi:hypothetical protein
MRVLHVTAPNYRWAQVHMREWFPELRSGRDWRYVSSPRDLMGLDERNVVVVFDRPADLGDFTWPHWWHLVFDRFRTVVWVGT